MSALDDLISELNSVIQLKDSHGWNIIVRDAKLAHDVAAFAWVDMWDEKQLFELRVKQCAARNIMTLMEQYEARLHEAHMELIRETEKDLMVGLDVDNNPPDIDEVDNGSAS